MLWFIDFSFLFFLEYEYTRRAGTFNGYDFCLGVGGNMWNKLGFPFNSWLRSIIIV